MVERSLVICFVCKTLYIFMIWYVSPHAYAAHLVPPTAEGRGNQRPEASRRLPRRQCTFAKRPAPTDKAHRWAHSS